MSKPAALVTEHTGGEGEKEAFHPLVSSLSVDGTDFRAGDKTGRMCVNLGVFTPALEGWKGACEARGCPYVREYLPELIQPDDQAAEIKRIRTAGEEEEGTTQETKVWQEQKTPTVLILLISGMVRVLSRTHRDQETLSLQG